jgi:serine/threonine protein kinase
MNVVGGIRFTRTHTYDRGGEEEIKNQTDAFNKDIQKELRWRDEMKHSNSGRLPNEISEIVKVTYTSRKTGEKKARYVGQLCDGEVADEMYTTSDGVRARKPSFDQQKVLRCYADVFTALDFLHERKIVHRDLKPGNVLVKGGKGVLNDFGSAGLAGSPEVIGTLGYTAPEILMLQGCDVSSDIFSMGMMLYETLDYAGFAALQESQWGLQQVAGQVAEVDSKDPKAKEELAKELNTYMGKLEEAREKMAASENPLLKFAGRLMNFDPTQRPTAKAAGEEYRKILAEGSGVEA